MKCRAMLSAIDATRYGFAQSGKTNKDSFSLKELHALSISMTTRMERDMVVAALAELFENISHPISGKRLLH